MYNYSTQLFLSILVFFAVLGCTQKPAGGNQQADLKFPNDWLGYWQGNLKIYNDTGMTMNIMMGLDLKELEKDSLFQWTLIYDLEGNRDTREYFLKPIDIQKGHWITDEDNSILLDGFRLDNGYFTVFEVGTTRIETSYVLEGEVMHFENRVIHTDTLNTSGGTSVGEIQIPKVTSYKLSGIQKAELQKIDK